MKSEIIIDHMLNMAQGFIASGQYDRAIELYKQITDLEPNADAYYNLGILCATGRGMEKDYIEAAKYFLKAQKCGDGEAEKMIEKCKLDHIDSLMSEGTYKALAYGIINFERSVYQRKDAFEAAGDDLTHYGTLKFGKGYLNAAYRAFRAAAEYLEDASSQYNLGILHLEGQGAEKSDLSAMYWFNKAADNGMSDGRTHSEGIFKAYFDNNSRTDFAEIIDILIKQCREGCKDFSADPKKAEYWKKRKRKALTGG